MLQQYTVLAFPLLHNNICYIKCLASEWGMSFKWQRFYGAVQQLYTAEGSTFPGKEAQVFLPVNFLPQKQLDLNLWRQLWVQILGSINMHSMIYSLVMSLIHPHPLLTTQLSLLWNHVKCSSQSFLLVQNEQKEPESSPLASAKHYPSLPAVLQSVLLFSLSSPCPLVLFWEQPFTQARRYRSVRKRDSLDAGWWNLQSSVWDSVCIYAYIYE